MPFVLFRDLELDFLLIIDLALAIGPRFTWVLFLSIVLVLCVLLVIPLGFISLVGLWIYGRLREPPVTVTGALSNTFEAATSVVDLTRL